MALPSSMTHFNRHANRFLGPVMRVLPGFGVVVHTGRKTGRQYRTPVKVFSRPRDYFIALTYGLDVDWVRNVLASGGCTLETRGRALRLTRPRLVRDERRRAASAPFRAIFALIHVSDFLELTLAD